MPTQIMVLSDLIVGESRLRSADGAIRHMITWLSSRCGVRGEVKVLVLGEESFL